MILEMCKDQYSNWLREINYIEMHQCSMKYFC